MELIEDEQPVEVDVRHDLVGSNKRLLQVIGGVALLGVLVLLLRPSGSSIVGPPLETNTTELQVASEAGPEPSARLETPSQTLVRPERLDMPASVDLPGPAVAFTLVGQNDRGQIVAVDLSTGAVSEIDRPSGQLFKPRVASDRRVAGFRVFLGESISIGADGVLRTMPVTEMDLPIVYRAADGDGFLIHEMATGALWAESDDGVVTGLASLPSDVQLRAVVDGGLIVATADGVDRRFDPASGVFGQPLVGRVLTHGRDRYVSQNCDGGTCVVTVRSLTDDRILAPIELELGPRDRLAVSPSGSLLAVTDGAALLVFDLSTGEQLGVIDGRSQPQFVWGPDDHLLYWSVSEVEGPLLMQLFDAEGLSTSLDAVAEVLDFSQPVHVIRS